MSVHSDLFSLLEFYRNARKSWKRGKEKSHCELKRRTSDKVQQIWSYHDMWYCSDHDISSDNFINAAKIKSQNAFDHFTWHQCPQLGQKTKTVFPTGFSETCGTVTRCLRAADVSFLHLETLFLHLFLSFEAVRMTCLPSCLAASLHKLPGQACALSKANMI